MNKTFINRERDSEIKATRIYKSNKWREMRYHVEQYASRSRRYPWQIKR